MIRGWVSVGPSLAFVATKQQHSPGWVSIQLLRYAARAGIDSLPLGSRAAARGMRRQAEPAESKTPPAIVPAPRLGLAAAHQAR